jgi:hypothetical protein
MQTMSEAKMKDAILNSEEIPPALREPLIKRLGDETRLASIFTKQQQQPSPDTRFEFEFGGEGIVVRMM